jgi:hypothetical protein
MRRSIRSSGTSAPKGGRDHGPRPAGGAERAGQAHRGEARRQRREGRYARLHGRQEADPDLLGCRRHRLFVPLGSRRPQPAAAQHYLLQAGWRADKAVQGFGRTHRTNEANQPNYILVETNLKAQRRFISSIARRLDQLGALTKGQRSPPASRCSPSATTSRASMPSAPCGSSSGRLQRNTPTSASRTSSRSRWASGCATRRRWAASRRRSTRSASRSS